MTTPVSYAGAAVKHPRIDGRQDQAAAPDSGRARLADGDPARRRIGAVHQVRPGLRLRDVSRRRQGLALPQGAGRQLRVRRRHGQAGARRHARRLADQGRRQRVLPRHPEPDARAGAESRVSRLEVHQPRDCRMVVNVPTEPYHYAEPDEFRLEPHDTLPYDWTRKDG